MEIPGLTGAMDDPQMRGKAEQESERLLDELKKSVKTVVKDVGVLRKELEITVPAKVIGDHLAHNYDELLHDALVPGFRKGRAPKRLIEKRFGSEVRDSIKTSILGQSFFAAVENEEFDVLGDPRFHVTVGEEVKLMEIGEALEHITITEDADFAYTCEVEIKPTFELPELEGIEIKAPQISITDEMIDEQLLRRRKIRGRYEPSKEAAGSEDDQLIADATLTVDGNVIKTEENVQLGVRAARLDTIPLMTLGEVLKGAKPGATRTVECQVPDDYERPDLRGKTGTFEFKIHEIKRLVPIPAEEYAEQMGCKSVAELREFIREDMEAERDDLIAKAKKEQVLEYLLEKTLLDLPEGLSARQTDHAVVRRVIELQQAGLPQSEIDAKIDELRTSAKESVARDLKLGFILGKVAEKLGAEVTDEEVNTEIARMARLYNRRFDRVRDDLQNQGLLDQLAEKIRHDKCVTTLLGDAKIIEVTGEPAAKSAKKTAKETAAKSAANKTETKTVQKTAKKAGGSKKGDSKAD